ncbi:DNA topoisomerase-3 [Lachnospiraceae bacterium KH1T2]|nr:DNA topoisomerase-3 [Lachnospiraceae bacterium KH1T2]
MRLVIAEKPSVAQSIAKVIGASEKRDGYLEGNGYLVSWCFGHLIELVQPQEYDPKYEKWKKDDLPIFPDPFRYNVTNSTKKQFKVLKNLMDRDDVTSLVEATDSGREGELIFRLVYKQAGCRKPFERLWISSMEDSAIREGFENLKRSTEYDALYEAALCRERADWIVGINATRLFSTLYGQKLNVGRVMTPTLGMIVKREADIQAFRPEPFYTVQVKVAGIEMTGERIKEKQEAEKCLKAVNESGIAVIQRLETKDIKEKAPLLYDLTSLQREANKYYGFTAQQTLDYTQSLYEKKLVTYPRTDSKYLTDDMADSAKVLADKMKQKFGYTKMLVMNVNAITNSKKVGDHHAIIPTVNAADAVFSEIPSGEQKILSLIAARLLSAIGDPAEYKEYALTAECGGQIFSAKAKAETRPGWKEIQEWICGKKDDEEEGADSNTVKNSISGILKADPDLLEAGKSLPAVDAKLKEGKTTAKKRFTEDSLLSAMERAGIDEMPDEAERKGLGTPATRAGIIEKLVRIGFIERKGDKKTKYLAPTHKGMALITVMPEVIQSPSLTAEWEQKLLDVEKNELSSGEFMSEIRQMVSELINTYEAVKDAEVMMKPKYEQIGTCPACGAEVVERSKGFFCSSNKCKFVIWKESRFMDALSKKMTKQIAVSLLEKGRCHLTKCRSVKTGKNYDTDLVMTADENGKVSYSLDFEKK